MLTDASEPTLTLKKYDKVVFGLLVVGAIMLVGGVGVGLFMIMPMLVELAKNTVIFFALLAVSILMLLFAAQAWMMRKTVIYKMKMIARNMRKAIIKSDPIGAIDVAIRNLQERLNEADEKAKDAEAATATLRKKIQNSGRTGVSDQADNEERLAKAAEVQGRSEREINQHYASAERWRQAEGQLKPLLANQMRRQEKIGQARELCYSGLADLKNRKEVLQVQVEAYQAEAAQSRAFRSFFGGNEDLDVIDMAVEEIERMSSDCEAEVTMMLRQADPMIERESLRQEADAAAARSRLTAKAPTKALPEAVPSASVLPVKDAEVVEAKRVH